MSTADYCRKLDELDRLLNDPDVPMQPDRIWSLLADVSRPDVDMAAEPTMAGVSGAMASTARVSTSRIIGT
jgi:hypothetical protein